MGLKGWPQCHKACPETGPLEATLMGAIQKLIPAIRAQTPVSMYMPFRFEERCRAKKRAPYQLPSPGKRSVDKIKVQSTHSLCPVNRTPTREKHCHTHPRPLETSMRFQASPAPQIQESLYTSHPNPTSSPWNRHKLSWGQTGSLGLLLLPAKTNPSLPNLQSSFRDLLGILASFLRLPPVNTHV